MGESHFGGSKTGQKYKTKSQQTKNGIFAEAVIALYLSCMALLPPIPGWRLSHGPNVMIPDFSLKRVTNVGHDT